MRYSADHKDEVHGLIVGAAARALREHGLDGLGVAQLMRRVGLTHGGFYNHFRNRDALVEEAVHRAASETARDVFDANDGDPDAMLSAYLSLDHVRSPGSGCVLAALGGEGGRQPSKRVRRAFSTAARGFLELVQRTVGRASGRRVDDRALAVASQMVGAVVLARLVDDDILATRILNAARRHSA